MTNRNQCLIYQRSTNEVLRSSNNGLNTFVTNIPRFNKLGRLKFGFSRVANENENLLSILNVSKTKYHSTCQSRYSESKLKRF